MDTMTLKHLFYNVLALFIAANAIAAAPTSEDFERVSQLPAWQKQLYVAPSSEAKQFNKRINDDSFYFSKTDTIDLLDELKATYQALFSDLDAINDKHPLCVFPSRFLFLNEALQMNSTIDPFVDCPGFSNWANIEHHTRIVVVKVDGYYGNPASSFGHLILRFSDGSTTNSLLDTSINYGARVPPGESTPVYIVKGLMGGYQASLTNDEFYRQDLVYSQTEFRDMWNYELNLSENQRRLFIAHIWELIGRPSTYYFLKNNCAFAVAEMLEFIMDLEFVDDHTLWYPPIRLFHDLDAFDANNKQALVASREYIPSQKKLLARTFSSLDATQKQAAMIYISSAYDASNIELDRLHETTQTEVIEALINYYDYLIKGYPELGSELYDRRKALIMARLTLPMGQTLNSPPVEAPGRPPGQSARSNKLEFGGLFTQHDTNMLFSATPFSTAPLDLGNPDLSELTLLKTELQVGDTVELRDFTLLRVAQRSDLQNTIPGDWPISWTIDFGINCLVDCNSQEGIHALVGLGQTITPGPFYVSGLVNLEWVGREASFRGLLEFGLPERHRLSAVMTAAQVVPFSSELDSHQILSLQTRYSVNPMHSVGFELTSTFNNDTVNTQGIVHWTWHFL